ncbi:MAG: hypothetical protein EOP49_42030, partial [Sphingobacteriales bacterium]
MKKADHIIPFTAKDIQRYHAGDMSMQERHAMEKAALEDPFLADAIEGYAHTATPEADLAELKDRLVAKTTSKKRGLLMPMSQRPFMRVAALVLLLAGAGWAIYRFSFPGKEMMAVSKEVTTPEQSTVVSDSTLKSAVVDSIIPSQAVVTPAPITATVPIVQPQRPAHEPISRKTAATRAAVPFPAAPVALEEAAKDQAEREMAKKSITTESTAAMANAARNQQALNTFRGQIVDPSGNPVPYASIVIDGKQNAVTGFGS